MRGKDTGTKDNNTALPTEVNPPNGFVPIIFQAMFTGIVFATLKFVDLETKIAALSPVPLDGMKTTLIVVIVAGFLQGHMAGSTNYFRIKFNVPWPHTFAPHGHKDKIAFDCVQRAHLNFVENYTQVLAVTFFAAQDFPHYALVCALFFLAGRLVFANGYYSGIAKNKDAGMFGYMLGYFPLYGLMNIYAAGQFGLKLV